MTVRLTSGAPFDLWSIDLSREPGRDDLAGLSAAEWTRARRFRFGRDRRRYLVAHAALRRLLDAPAREPFETGAFGKPRLGRAGLEFSLSYAGDLALVGLSNGGAIGVDIEPLRAIAGADVTDDIFDAGEMAAIAGKPAGTARDRAFLSAWTRKEACVKAAGTGLTTPPACVVVGTDNDVRRVSVATERGDTPIEVGSFEVGDRIAAWARVL